MKARTLAPLFTCALALGAGACSNNSAAPAPAEEQTASAEQKIVAGFGNIMMWPAGPIAWDGLMGTWPISVWSPVPIGALAFDIVGVTGLGVTAVGLPDLVALPISTAYLGAFGFGASYAAGFAAGAVGPWVTPILGPAGVYAPAYGYAGVYDPWIGAGFDYGFGAYGAGLWGAYAPGFAPWLTPALTSSALMFNDLVALDAFTPYTFNVTFTAPSYAQAATMTSVTAMNSLSIFATSVATDAIVAGTAITFTSMIYPILLPFAPVAPLAAPVVGPLL